MNICESDRLVIRQFTLADADFIIELLNDEAFIRYIADKKVRNIVDAHHYIKTGPMIGYQRYGYGLNLVLLKASNTPIGMCGLLKRDELEHPDLGYAFLPLYCGKGYAFEAANAVLQNVQMNHALTVVQAVTRTDNLSSNKLLKKVGFIQDGMIELYNSANNLYTYTLTNKKAQ